MIQSFIHSFIHCRSPYFGAKFACCVDLSTEPTGTLRQPSSFLSRRDTATPRHAAPQRRRRRRQRLSLEQQPSNMSSGSLPLATYHRAQSLGSGSYGSVITVYDDDGQEFALKLFEEDDDDDEVGMPLGALREISVLRLLRGQNEHPNIIAMHDVQTGFYDDGEEGGAGTEGYLAMVR
jgi:serine/threonine protein kinase